MGGAIIMTSSVIKLLSYSPVDFLTKFESFSWMLDIAFFITCIWGSVKVFGKYYSSRGKRQKDFRAKKLPRLTVRYEFKLFVRRRKKAKKYARETFDLKENAPLYYRAPKICLYVVARNFFLLLLTCSAWPCLGPA